MTESSYLWTTGGAGDGAATYTRSDWSTLLKVVAACMDEEGVAPALLNVCAPSTTGANNARIGTGGAMVDGKPYYNSAAVDVTIPSASGGGNTRIDRVVLRADWTAQTVRVTRIAGTDAASPTAPAITQTTGVTYDILLCQALVNTSGTVSITDERTFAIPGTDSIATAAIRDAAISFAKFGNLAALSVMGRAANSSGVSSNITATAASGAVLRESGSALAFGTIDETAIGNRIPTLENRQGGNASGWSATGTNNYVPTTMQMQVGAALTDGSGIVAVTFPVAFSDYPIVIAMPVNTTGAYTVVWSALTVSAVTLRVFDSAGSAVAAASVHWIAIGPL